MTMEKMTKAEKDKLRQLQAKEKRVARAEKEFRCNVLERRDDVLGWLGVSDTAEPSGTEARLAAAAAVYGICPDELLDYISSGQQVSYYRHNHPDRSSTGWD